jgi:hypothetical protein
MRFIIIRVFFVSLLCLISIGCKKDFISFPKCYIYSYEVNSQKANAWNNKKHYFFRYSVNKETNFNNELWESSWYGFRNHDNKVLNAKFKLYLKEDSTFHAEFSILFVSHLRRLEVLDSTSNDLDYSREFSGKYYKNADSIVLEGVNKQQDRNIRMVLKEIEKEKKPHLDHDIYN